jgi:hypothetical protein
MIARVRHLVRRTRVSLKGRVPEPADEAWAAGILCPAELQLWRQMSDVDRSHAIEVARGACRRLGQPVPDEVATAALLHDVGKLDADLGVPGRILATVISPIVPARWAPRLGRIGCQLRYNEIGSGLLADAGSERMVVAWAREHHWPPDRWTVDRRIGQVLRDADDAAG